MAEERIDIKLTDKVDASVAKKMNEIADGADRAESYLKRLQNALSSVNTSAVDKLASAMAKADAAQAKLLNSQARLTTAQNAGSVAATKVALANQKLATEAARTEAAQARAAAATSSAESAALRLQAAQARLTGSSNGVAVAQQQVGVAEIRVAVAADRASNSVAGYISRLLGVKSASSSAVAANQAIANSTNNVVDATANASRVQRRAMANNANIIAQLNDIGVSLAGGQNPLLVAVQQGSQLSYIAGQMEGGFKALLGTILRMLAPFTLLAAGLGLLVGAFKSFQVEVNNSAKGELEAYANTLGLTDKEMRKLSNSSVDASGKLKSFDTIVVTMGDTWKGFILTIKQSFSGFSDEIASVTSFMAEAWDKTLEFMKIGVALLWSQYVGTFKGVVAILRNLPSVAANTAAAVANGMIGAIEWLVNKTIAGLNVLIAGAQPILEQFGVNVSTIGEASFGRFAQDGKTAAGVMADAYKESYSDATGFMDDFAKKWRANTIQMAKDRIKGAANAIIGNRNPSTGGADTEAKMAERRAHAIAMVNLQLDNELSRMKLLKDERAIAQRMDQIEQSLAQKKITLNAAEKLSIENKVRAIEAYKYVQSEMDRMYESVNGPLRTYNAALAASSQLLADGKLTLEQYSLELGKAEQTYQKAVDPLYQFNQALDSQAQTLGKYGEALEDAIYLEQIRQALINEGYTGELLQQKMASARVANLLAENAAMREKQMIQSTLASALNPILEQDQEIIRKEAVYSELERLRQEDIIKEDQYQRAKAALAVKYDEGRLNATSDFFGALASVTAKGHGAIGAISKAAAIAQATIDGYVAVQKALASLPPPFNFAAAAAVAIKTGAQIAGIVSTNAGSFATGGQFMVGGKDGVDANNINMNVTKGERVTIETAAQQRENDAASQGAGAQQVNVPVRVVAQFDPKMALDALDTAAGERVVISMVERNPAVFQRLLGSR